MKKFLKNDRMLICITSFVIAGLILYAISQSEQPLPSLDFAVFLCPFVGINVLFLDKKPGKNKDKE